MHRVLAVVAALTAVARCATGQVFDFTINTPQSGLLGTAGVDVDTSGTLIGAYDAASNPTGTRTKPGIFGTFGETENLPVDVTLGSAASGPVNTRASGGFRLGLELDGGMVSLSNYSANFLSNGPATLPVTLSLLFESFRTRNPSSTYIGGVPLNIPLGQASLTRLEAQQVIPAQGSLVPTGPGTFDFSVTTLVNLTVELSFLGTPLALPPIPTPLLLAGQVTVGGTSAQLVSVQPFDFSNTAQPGVALPQFPLELPTVLPPGLTANVLFDLTLDAVSAGLDTTMTTNATGVLVPAPASLAVFGLVFALRRRRA